MEDESRSGRWPGANLNGTARRLQHSSAERQPQPMPDTLVRGEKWLEDPRLCGGIHADTLVHQGDNAEPASNKYVNSQITGSQDRTCREQRANGVLDQVVQHLVELPP